MFTRLVEVDETCVERRERSKHHNRRRGPRHPEGKNSVILDADRSTGNSSAMSVRMSIVNPSSDEFADDLERGLDACTFSGELPYPLAL